MTDTDALLEGLRVLIVEDEAAISLILEELLADFGCVIVGSAARLNEAIGLAQNQEIDVAILDINISGQEVYPVADVLLEKKVPIIMTTGYGDSGVRAEYRQAFIIQKPFRLSELKKALDQAAEAARSSKV